MKIQLQNTTPTETRTTVERERERVKHHTPLFIPLPKTLCAFAQGVFYFLHLKMWIPLTT